MPMIQVCHGSTENKGDEGVTMKWLRSDWERSWLIWMAAFSKSAVAFIVPDQTVDP